MTKFINFAQEKKKESTLKVVHKKHMNLKMLHMYNRLYKTQLWKPGQGAANWIARSEKTADWLLCCCVSLSALSD